MKAHNYHRVLETLDQALQIFAESANELSADDYQIKHQIELIRSSILKAESAAPFPLGDSAITSLPASTPAPADLEITRAPW